MESMNGQFSIREARSLVKDLSTPNPWIYWGDFLASILVGHIGFLLLIGLGFFFHDTWQQSPNSYWIAASVLFATSAICYMRAVMFIHELVHLPGDQFKGFRMAWNLLCGIPFLVPSFLYYTHVDHHRRKLYGTDKDGEYLHLSHEHPVHSIGFILAAAIVPGAAVLRFAVMTPIAWVLPQFQLWMEKHASSMIIDIFYLRNDFGNEARRIMRLQEVLCFVWCVGCAALWCLGLIPAATPLVAYLFAVTLVAINNIRTLGAHRWVGDGRELTFEDQLLDTVNYPYRPWITELWGPVGNRYHALHHLFPSLPYHNLGIAHRRLMAGLPEDSIYRQTVRVSLVGAIAELLGRANHRHNMSSDTPFHAASTTTAPMNADRAA